jgi:tetratricopeptide (TPR) repeat protein
VLTLPPLDVDDSTQLIANLLDGGRLPGDAVDRVADAGGGNPLFVEQMVSMLIDDGLVVREDGGWTTVGDLSSISVPPTVAALLASRLERLSDDERRAIGAASVIGKDFYLGAVRELLPQADHSSAGTLVRSLVRKELVREARSTIPGEDAFEFRHILIRDAAYAAIPKERRSEQHRRFADWCVRIAGERIEEQEEIVGYHLEQAFRYRETLGPLDAEARALASEASARLEAAGMRAFDRPDMAAAANLLRRAEALLAPEDPHRVAILTSLAYALYDIGRLDEARDTVVDAEARAAGAGDPVGIERTRIARWQLVERGAEWQEQVRAQATAAIEVFEAAGDERGLVRAWNLLTSAEWVVGQGGAQLDAVERALEHARSGTARYEEHEALSYLTSALVRGPTPVSDGIARAERTIEAYAGSREVDALMCHALAHLRARLGDFGAARAAMDRYRTFYRDTGQTMSYLHSVEVAFDLAMLEGDAEHACDVAEEAWRSLKGLGDSWSYLAAFLGQGRYAVGRYTDAREAAAFALEHGDDVEGSLALGVLAKVAARSGDAAKALETIAEAVERVDRTDFLFDRGTVHTDRGETLRLLGRDDEAASAVDEAIRLFDQKGDLVSSERVRRLRAEAMP